jgi:2,3-dihydroxybenzoate decarboxylase
VRRVALEEAFWFGELTTPGSFTAQHTPIKAEVLADYARRLADFTEFRLPEMDRHGVDMQVLSLTLPSIQMQSDTQVAVSDARTANDYLALVVARHVPAAGRNRPAAVLLLQRVDRPQDLDVIPPCAHGSLSRQCP